MSYKGLFRSHEGFFGKFTASDIGLFEVRKADLVMRTHTKNVVCNLSSTRCHTKAFLDFMKAFLKVSTNSEKDSSKFKKAALFI